MRDGGLSVGTGAARVQPWAPESQPSAQVSGRWPGGGGQLSPVRPVPGPADWLSLSSVLIGLHLEPAGEAGTGLGPGGRPHSDPLTDTYIHSAGHTWVGGERGGGGDDGRVTAG